jgi:hypothetical protein
LSQFILCRVSCFLRFFCPPGSERCFKNERKRVRKTGHGISSKFDSNILLLLLYSRKFTKMLRIVKKRPTPNFECKY